MHNNTLKCSSSTQCHYKKQTSLQPIVPSPQYLIFKKAKHRVTVALGSTKCYQTECLKPIELEDGTCSEPRTFWKGNVQPTILLIITIKSVQDWHWLDVKYIETASQLLSSQFPALSGFYSTNFIISCYHRTFHTNHSCIIDECYWTT